MSSELLTDTDTDTDWYDRAHAAVGGDDFVEHLGAEWVEEMLKTAKAGKPVRISMTKNAMRISMTKNAMRLLP